MITGVGAIGRLGALEYGWHAVIDFALHAFLVFGLRVSNRPRALRGIVEMEVCGFAFRQQHELQALGIRRVHVTQRGCEGIFDGLFRIDGVFRRVAFFSACGNENKEEGHWNQTHTKAHKFFPY